MSRCLTAMSIRVEGRSIRSAGIGVLAPLPHAFDDRLVLAVLREPDEPPPWRIDAADREGRDQPAHERIS